MNASRFPSVRWILAARSPAAFAGALLVAAGCATVTPPPPARPPSPPEVPAGPAVRFSAEAWSAIPGWSDDRVEEAWPAWLVSCRALVARESTRDAWQAPCGPAAAVDPRDRGAVRRYFETHFTPWSVAFPDGRTTGLVTGYYEPLLRGSRTRTPAFTVPLYAQPDDLLTVELASLHPELKDRRVRARVEGRRVVPYWTRAEIERGAARLEDKVLVYVADPLDAAFLQIQGSGRVELPGGSVMRVGYADQNGHPFRSIGRVLIERGELTRDTASMQSIKAWARRNPDKLEALLDENPSYVFFRDVPPPAPGTIDATIDGPYGSLGVPLLAERAIAVDARVIPLGAPVFLATTWPLSDTKLERLTMAQDTGGAIRGAVRADYFWGFGDEAGREAGRMRQDGSMWLLWPRGRTPPR
ncbi:membrane-bound lytic murein transglycosylase A [Burkholderiales bacterium]|nr:membrane-bound lytic murein transglycosylase A [Burkholderiales bacterium]